MGRKILLVSLALGAVAALGIYFLSSSLWTRGGSNLRTVTIPPGGSERWVQFVDERGSFRFGVLPRDGRVTMANGKVHDEERETIDPAAIVTVIKDGWWVDAGTPREWSGRLSRGLHLWIVVNQSKDKPVTVTIDFYAATHP